MKTAALTSRQIRVLDLLEVGNSPKEIAKAMDYQIGSVDAILRILRTKFQAKSDIHLIRLYDEWKRSPKDLSIDPSSVNPDGLLKVNEACALLRIHPNTFRRWADEERFKVHRLGPRGDRRVRRGDILALLEE